MRTARKSPEAVRFVLTPAGTVTELRDSKALVLSDLAPNIRQAVALVATLESVDATAAIEEVEVRNTSPVTLAAWVSQLEETSSQVTGAARSGKLVANAGSGTILIVAPMEEQGSWREQIQRFDRVERAYRRDYAPKRFGLAETADLIERAVYGGGADDPAGTWELVVDQLTGTLIITAPHSKHAEIDELLARLESEAYGDRRPMRAFPIRNRQVAEMVEILKRLLEAGALDLPETPAMPIGEIAQGATGILPSSRRSNRIEDAAGVTLTADEPTNRIVAMGEARLLDQLELLIETLDVRHAQVLVEAIVVTLSETDTFDLGVELRRAGASDGTLFELASLFGLSSVTAGSATIPAATGTGFSGVLLDPRDFSAVIRALETLNEGRSLTIPRVLVNNNQDAILESVAQSPLRIHECLGHGRDNVVRRHARRRHIDHDQATDRRGRPSGLELLRIAVELHRGLGRPEPPPAASGESAREHRDHSGWPLRRRWRTRSRDRNRGDIESAVARSHPPDRISVQQPVRVEDQDPLLRVPARKHPPQRLVRGPEASQPKSNARGRSRRGLAATSAEGDPMRLRHVALVILASLHGACNSTQTEPRSPYTTPGESERDTQQAELLNRQAAQWIDTDPNEAEVLLRQALALDIFYGPAHNNLGVLHLNRDRLYEAATEFEWARKLMSGHPDPRVNLAIVLERAGRPEDAAEAFMAALEEQTDYLPAVQGIALLTVTQQWSDERLRGWLEQVAMRTEDASWRSWALSELAR